MEIFILILQLGNCGLFLTIIAQVSTAIKWLDLVAPEFVLLTTAS
jgi:hypothetical protein